MNKRKKKSFGNFTGSDEHKTESPKFSLVGAPHIELLDNKEAVVEGCKCIVEYNDSSIKLNMGNKILRFTGRCLTIRTMQPEHLIICGDIISMDFCT